MGKFYQPQLTFFLVRMSDVKNKYFSNPISCPIKKINKSFIKIHFKQNSNYLVISAKFGPLWQIVHIVMHYYALLCIIMHYYELW